MPAKAVGVVDHRVLGADHGDGGSAGIEPLVSGQKARAKPALPSSARAEAEVLDVDPGIEGGVVGGLDRRRLDRPLAGAGAVRLGGERGGSLGEPLEAGQDRRVERPLRRVPHGRWRPARAPRRGRGAGRARKCAWSEGLQEADQSVAVGLGQLRHGVAGGLRLAAVPEDRLEQRRARGRRAGSWPGR